MLRRTVLFVVVVAFLSSLSVILFSPTQAHAHQSVMTSTAHGRWVTVTSRGRTSTLWGIAATVYGSGHTWPSIYAANRSRIANPHWIYPGQQLWVPTRGGASAPPSTKTPTISNRAAVVVAYALAQRGDPYRWGAAGPNAFDCSGLVLAAYARIGIRLYHQSYAMARYGRAVSRANLRPGDIVSPESGHVGIYIGGGKIVHSPHPGAYVRVDTLYSFNWARRLV